MNAQQMQDVIKQEVKQEKIPEGRPTRTVVMEDRLRDKKGDENKGTEEKRRENQKKLAEQKLAEARERLLEQKSGQKRKSASVDTNVQAYRDPTQVPRDAKRQHIMVDNRAEAVLVPIYGYLVPFHISIVKSATKYDEFLRLNFNTPTGAFGQTNAVTRSFNC